MSTDISLHKYLQGYAEYHQTAENLYPVGMSGASVGLGDIILSGEYWLHLLISYLTKVSNPSKPHFPAPFPQHTLPRNLSCER